jgi:hypothetical protein
MESDQPKATPIHRASRGANYDGWVSFAVVHKLVCVLVHIVGVMKILLNNFNWLVSF